MPVEIPSKISLSSADDIMWWIALTDDTNFNKNYFSKFVSNKYASQNITQFQIKRLLHPAHRASTQTNTSKLASEQTQMYFVHKQQQRKAKCNE